MKRFLKHILLFGFIFFIVEKSVWFLLDTAPKREYDTRLEQLLKGKINKDLIVIGSSRGAGNILAKQLENETGLLSYNLSYQGTDIKHQKFILETVLKYNKAPKVVVISIDSPSEFKKSKSVFFRNGALLPLSKYNYINEKLIENNLNTSLSRVFFIARLNTHHFSFQDKKPSKINPIESNGSMPLLQKKKTNLSFATEANNYDISGEDDTKISAFLDIQNICRNNNIELIYVISPNFKSFNMAFFKRFKMLTREEKIMVYDTLNPIYKEEAYFYDMAHLLKNGAEVFTSEISEFINGK